MCIFSKIKNIFELDRLVEMWNTPPIDADYYNNSENELKNIFLELSKLSQKPVSIINQDYIMGRLWFLANEGLHIVESQNLRVKQTKVTKKDFDKIIAKANKSKKVTTKKKTVKGK
jgi:hypothetical protein